MILVSVPLIFELIFVLSLGVVLKHAQERARISRQGKDVISKVGNWAKYLVEANSSLYVYGFTRDPAYFQSYERSVAKIPATREKLYRISEPFPEVKPHIEALDRYSSRMIKLLDSLSEMAESGGRIKMAMVAKSYYARVREVYPRFMDEVEYINQGITRTIAAEAEEDRNAGLLWIMLAAGVILSVILTIVLAAFYSRGITHRLAVLMQNTVRMREKKPLNAPIPGADEIAELDHVFHDMADALEKAEKRKQEYVSMISHDLRSPLTALQTTLAMALKGSYGELNEKGQARILTAEHSVERLIKLINELLDMERMEAGMLKLSIASTPLDRCVERSIDAVKSLAEKEQVAISAGKSDIRVMADEDRLVQVLINLLSNAIKYSPEGGRISCEFQIGETDVRIQVVDEGSGIPPDAIERIFDRFQQVDSPEGKERGGSGLGLAICKAIVEGHGGTIGAVSEPGNGSRFWFTVPRA